MRNRTYGGVRGRKTKVGRKLLRFPPTRLRQVEDSENIYGVLSVFVKALTHVTIPMAHTMVYTATCEFI